MDVGAKVTVPVLKPSKVRQLRKLYIKVNLWKSLDK